MALLDDLATGAASVLEREYLRSVERPHGLGAGARRQGAGLRTSAGRCTARDVDYPRIGVVVELDGRPFHDTARARDADHERDLATAALEGATTLRLT